MIDKIRESLQKKKQSYMDEYGMIDIKIQEVFVEIRNIINQVEAEYNNVWISVEDRLPETNDAVNVVWVNRKPKQPYYASIKDKPFVATAHYHNGKWYWYSSVCKDYLDEYGNSSMDKVDKYIDIIAWQPLPQPPLKLN